MSERNNIEKCVGIADNRLYMVISFFQHDDSFQGATGYIFAPISQDYIDTQNDPETLAEQYDYLWKEYAQAGTTKKGLIEFMEELIQNNKYTGGLYVGHDDSGIYDIPDEIKEQYFPDAESFECIGAGRIFSKETLDSFDTIIDAELLQQIKDYEKIAEAGR